MNRQVEYLLGDSPDTLFMSPDYAWIHLFGHSAWLMYYAQKSGVGEFARTGPLNTRAAKDHCLLAGTRAPLQFAQRDDFLLPMRAQRP